ncbi:MAG: hypothetical protein KJP09_07110 [Bacteroidia bacterium]|nr:hypothetical protein [Bacteroidia bacterium]MBT8310330.1 hypothetical protein [Bacteroidia bacterium]NND10532.1 hypothetical protein [Flavobacteriaceae bacterium]NNK28318.1 hypothetical protein [Flavobacteriaceae bacterium]NNL61427.1 hypothetical protein [Flavobacteriaceae bacterium]
MKAVSVIEIKKELKERSHQDLMDLCLRLARFKKENKELLTYLLFESHNEEGYIETVKDEVDLQFDNINADSFFYIKKSVRKILRMIKKYNRYSLKKETEVELLLYFCEKLNDFEPSISRNRTLVNLYNRQINFIKKKIDTLHEDLQYDYNTQLQELDHYILY